VKMEKRNVFKIASWVEVILVVWAIVLLFLNADVNLYKTIILLGCGLLIEALKGIFS